jgi:hypothetical protein
LNAAKLLITFSHVHAQLLDNRTQELAHSTDVEKLFATATAATLAQDASNALQDTLEML